MGQDGEVTTPYRVVGGILSRLISRVGMPLVVLALTAGRCSDSPADMALPAAPAVPTMTAWADEFDGAGGSSPDARKWTYDLGNNNGWGNNELQSYTANARNVHLDGDGRLIIRVESTPTGFTSARLKTRGLLLAQYGRVEARIRVPAGQGLWPAFWMLGSTFDGTNWPACGEIDIMEHVGRSPSTVRGTVHGPGYSGGRGVTGMRVLPDGARMAEDFHTFAIQWAPQRIAFDVDGVVYHTVTPASLPAGAPWVFDRPFFVLLNVAVGGNFPGPPDATTQFPQEMRVDYVRYTPLSSATLQDQKPTVKNTRAGY